MNRLFSLQQTKRGDLILVVQPLFSWRRLGSGVTQVLIQIFETVNRLTAYHGWLSLVAALGLGIGLGVTVFQRPSSSFAGIVSFNQNDGVEVEAIFVPSLQIMTSVSSGELPAITAFSSNYAVRLESSSQLEQSGVLVIYGANTADIFGRLASARLGDEIVLEGDNNGRYHFTITEIRTVKRDELSANLNHLTQGLVLITPTGLFGQSFMVVIAQST